MLTYRKLLCTTITLLACACGSNEPASSSAYQTAQATTDAADSAGASDTVTGQGRNTDSAKIAQKWANIGQNLQGGIILEPVVQSLQASDTVQNKAVVNASVGATFSYQGCKATFDGNATLDSNADTYTIDASIQYDPNACKFARKVSGTTFVTAVYGDKTRQITVDQNNVVVTFKDGDQVTINSNTLGQPTYVLTGDTTTSFDSNVTISATVNEHRHRLNADGNVVFDLSINTDPNAPLQIVNGYIQDTNAALTSASNQTRTIVSGVTSVVHHLAKYTATYAFDHVQKIIDSCNCPTSGVLTESVVYQDTSLGGYTRVYTFTGCGKASVNTTASTNPNVTTGQTEAVFEACN